MVSFAEALEMIDPHPVIPLREPKSPTQSQIVWHTYGNESPAFIPDCGANVVGGELPRKPPRSVTLCTQCEAQYAAEGGGSMEEEVRRVLAEAREYQRTHSLTGRTRTA